MKATAPKHWSLTVFTLISSEISHFLVVHKHKVSWNTSITQTYVGIRIIIKCLGSFSSIYWFAGSVCNIQHGSLPSWRVGFESIISKYFGELKDCFVQKYIQYNLKISISLDQALMYISFVGMKCHIIIWCLVIGESPKNIKDIIMIMKGFGKPMFQFTITDIDYVSRYTENLE